MESFKVRNWVLLCPALKCVTCFLLLENLTLLATQKIILLFTKEICSSGFPIKKKGNPDKYLLLLSSAEEVTMKVQH